MTRDPLLPVHKADGVWTTEGAVEIAEQTFRANMTFPEPLPSTTARNFRCIPDPPTFRGVAPPPHSNTEETSVPFDADATCPGKAPIPVRVVVTWVPPRSIFAVVALDGSGVWAIGDSAEEAQDRAVERRTHLYKVAERVGAYYPPPTPDAAWLDTRALVTLSGTTESLRAIVAAIGEVIPWCPADLWDDPEPDKESPCFEMT